MVELVVVDELVELDEELELPLEEDVDCTDSTTSAVVVCVVDDGVVILEPDAPLIFFS